MVIDETRLHMLQCEHSELLASVDQRAKSNTRRIDKLEQSTEALNDLATSVKLMSADLHRTAETVDKLDGKVTALEMKPAKRWEGIIEKAIWAVLAAFIGFALAQIGL